MYQTAFYQTGLLRMSALFQISKNSSLPRTFVAVMFLVGQFAMVDFALGKQVELTGIGNSQEFEFEDPRTGMSNAGRTPRPGFQFVEKNSELQYRFVLPSSFSEGTTMHGYRLIKIEVFNGDQVKHRVKAEVNFSPYTEGPFGKFCKSTTSSEIELEAGAVASLRTYAPNLTAATDEAFLEVDGSSKRLNRAPDIDHLTGSLFSRYRMDESSASMLFALSPSIEPKISETLSRIKSVESVDSYTSSYGYYSYGGTSSNAMIKNVELMWAPNARDWDDEWISYTSYTNLGMSKTFFDELPETKKQAIQQYIAIGGMITFLESEELPDEFNNVLLGKKTRRQLLVGRKQLDSEIERHSYGLGVINIVPSKITEWKPEDLYGIGFPQDQINWEPLIDGLKRQSFYENAYSDSAQSELPMVEEKKVNQQVVFWSVFSFILMVGPINYFVARMYFKNMMAILVTTPVFSIIVTILFVIGDYMSQGFTATTTIECFTVLDEKNRQAYSVGTTGYYSPIQPGQLVFDANTELLPTYKSGSDDINSYRRPDLTPADISFAQNKQILLSGWVKPRESAYFHFRQSARSDLRVAFEETKDGGIRAINGLGVEIAAIHYRHTDGKLYVGASIAAGESSILDFENRSNQQTLSPGIPEEINRLIPLRGRSIFSGLIQNRSMKNGHYIVETVESAFVQPGQSETIVKPKSSFIYGIRGE